MICRGMDVFSLRRYFDLAVRCPFVTFCAVMSTPTPYQESSPPTLPAPCPTQPVAGRPVDRDAPVFDWVRVPTATHYRVQIASTEAFESLHYDDVTERGTALPMDSVLPDDVNTAYWRVRAKTTDDERSSWSDPAHFAVPTAEREVEEAALRVDAPPMPLHPESTQGAPVNQNAVHFSWDDIPEASGYRLQVATTEDFADPDVDLTVDRTTAVTLYEVLSADADVYYWRVRPLFRVADPGPWSSPVSFRVAPPAEEENLVPEAADPQASARAAGPVVKARTSRAFSLAVSLFALLTFFATIALIFLVG